MTRLDKLWRAVDGPGSPPRLDKKRVKAQVNAALDAEQSERKSSMKRKIYAVLAVAAVAAAITGTALAAVTNWNALSSWFKGDTAPGLEYLDTEIRSVSDENYSLTVESSAADENSVYLVVSVTAISSEAKAFLYDENFDSIDTFYAHTESPDGSELLPLSFGCRELESEMENCRRFALDVSLCQDTGCAVSVRCGYMEKGKWVRISFDPAPSAAVKIGASGTGILTLYPASTLPSQSLKINEVTFTPFSCRVALKRSSLGIAPRLLLRMKDGSVRTQAQMMSEIDGSLEYVNYRFHEVQDLDNISSVIVFDMEYPLDGSKPVPVEHDPSLDPFTIRRMDRLEEGSAYSIPVRELTERLGGTFHQDPVTGEATCVYRDTTIVLRAGDNTALVNGEAVAMAQSPAVQDGVLAAPSDVFRNAWGIDCAGLREERIAGGEMEILWLDWYIVP